MPKSKLSILSKSPAHFRIECECGKFIHEVKAGENGNPVFDSFVVSQKEEPQSKEKLKKNKGLLDDFFASGEEEGD